MSFTRKYTNGEDMRRDWSQYPTSMYVAVTPEVLAQLIGQTFITGDQSKVKVERVDVYYDPNIGQYASEMVLSKTEPPRSWADEAKRLTAMREAAERPRSVTDILRDNGFGSDPALD